ncbi:hypothetical protein BX616_001285 [Lobosporangium transversale]|uniref:VASt domain-containing protein n=1 Tax=Lobosporangium transversale TaxID=64571 RepID=A0A1Y2GCW2_9FUNG|nr:hypothetical protein BCR41DRAFT_360289 [Lobosporangium transversale]KAF9904472.1 hypothetical protein BX616_001285 [Lobosporangium transversale]ORZ07270.1 hypothetical protein BCR41DRAFT_360289 [Lobosporangium transversale]|eukprot:XP_021877933.1 hypothetical protein BCR41DRAFT_360289 [Lobosporangium transversale]
MASIGDTLVLEQQQQQQQPQLGLQQEGSAQLDQSQQNPALQPKSSNDDVTQSHSSSGFLASVRNVANKTTDILGISHNSDNDNGDIMSSSNINSSNTSSNKTDQGQAHENGGVDAIVHEANYGTAAAAASPVPAVLPVTEESTQATQNESMSTSPATAFSQSTVNSLPPSLPSTSITSITNTTTLPCAPPSVPTSVPADSTLHSSPTSVSTLPSDYSNSNNAPQQLVIPANTQYSNNSTNPAVHKTMDPSQSDLMTMEAFQMNGGASPYNNYNTDYSNNNVDPSTYTAPTGPGSFPETFGTHGQQPFVQNDEIGPLSRDSNEGDDANINFVYANEKRFNDFHALFRSVPEEEKLIEDYGCALQKEILVQGRLYISENHVCFNANIFGWVTNLVIAFSEIIAIEKRLTAFVIPNAISIVTATNTKGHFFASFLSRDTAYDLLMAAWRKSFPCAANTSALTNNVYIRQDRSSTTLNEDEDDAESFSSVRVASTESKRNRHRSSSSASQHWTADEADWDEHDADGKPWTGGHRRRGSKRKVVKKILKEVIAPIIHDDDNKSEHRKGRGRSVSELPPPPPSFDYGRRGSIESKSSGVGKNSSETSRPSIGSEPLDPNRSNGAADTGLNAGGASKSSNNTNHSPTTCKCSGDGRHYANTYMSEKYPGSIESMWKLLFESDFTKSFLTSDAMKGADVQEEPWRDAADGTSTKVTKYTKWLGMPIGPKTTKATLTDVCEHKDFDDYVTNVTTTSTPDVPSGGCFTTKCRTCITWAGPNQIQVVVTGAIEFTKSSWIKGQIEKGAGEGMTAHYKELHQSINKYIADHPEEFGGSGSSNGATADTVSSSTPKQSPARSRTSSRSVKKNHKLDKDMLAEGVDVNKPLPPVSPTTSVTPNKNKNKDNQVEAGGIGGVWSRITSMFSSADSEGASHFALVAVLLLVMLANIYIWFQISNVTSQIERIQSDILGQMRENGKGHQHKGSYSFMMDTSEDGTNAFEYAELSPEERYAREQEDAMWAWLTEREERHREFQRKGAQDWLKSLNDHKEQSNNGNESNNGESSTSQEFSVTEAKLQARINELQQQLEGLEQALDKGGAAM